MPVGGSSYSLKLDPSEHLEGLWHLPMCCKASSADAGALQVDAMLHKQADAAKIFVGEMLDMLVGYHNTFNPLYTTTCNNLQKDVEYFKEQASRPMDDIQASLGFVSLAQPFLATLFPELGAVGGIAVSMIC